MRKRVIAVICSCVVMIGCLSACGSNTESSSAPESKNLQIVTTIFPIYDWVREILGENPAGIELTMLMDNGVDLHSFQPTAMDILRVSSCDMFVYVGGESDQWVEDAMQEAANEKQKEINLMESLGDGMKEEQIVEGMQPEEEDTESEEPEYDEHVWLSLKNASILCGRLAKAIREMDPDHAEIYEANVTAYQQKLADLDNEYQSVVNESSQKTVLFGDRFPFRYLTDDYSLDYYAAFAGCSAETEASFETISFLAGKVDELGLNSVMTIEGSDQRIAETIIQNTKEKDQKILTMDSMQATTSKDAGQGATYLSIMEKNKNVLKEALQ
ncbi:MAG: zinc ABC transporter substrate-binding protein [Oscillospiraceae bacterium]|nr:zinc ABC transporter substrate-binding protein [Oscillospiraceae bacterium]